MENIDSIISVVTSVVLFVGGWWKAHCISKQLDEQNKKLEMLRFDN